MIGDFIGDGKKYPACGISFGLDAIFEILKQRQMERTNASEIYIVPMGNKAKALKVAENLRRQSVKVDLEMGNRKLKKVLDYANEEKIPFVMIMGEEELKEGKVVIKNMKNGKQEMVKIEEVFQAIQIESVPYQILNPGGNKTALVFWSEYSQEEKKKINDKILSENKEVEQVGFLNQKENELEMAGGEFCVNATRCAIWSYRKGEPGEIKLSVSGYQGEIMGGITEEKEVYARLEMNKTLEELLETKGIFNWIKLDGIWLAIVEEENAKEYLDLLKREEEEGKNRLKEQMQNFPCEEKAMGIIFVEREEEKIKINPVIWVKSIDTIYYETACGSGSLATAIWFCAKNGTTNMEIMQPSGYKIQIQLEKEANKIVGACVKGKVLEETKEN